MRQTQLDMMFSQIRRLETQFNFRCSW